MKTFRCISPYCSLFTMSFSSHSNLKQKVKLGGRLCVYIALIIGGFHSLFYRLYYIGKSSVFFKIFSVTVIVSVSAYIWLTAAFRQRAEPGMLILMLIFEHSFPSARVCLAIEAGRLLEKHQRSFPFWLSTQQALVAVLVPVIRLEEAETFRLFCQKLLHLSSISSQRCILHNWWVQSKALLCHTFLTNETTPG